MTLRTFFNKHLRPQDSCEKKFWQAVDQLDAAGVREMLEAGVSVNAQDENGNTAFLRTLYLLTDVPSIQKAGFSRGENTLREATRELLTALYRDYDTDLKIQNDTGVTALSHLATADYFGLSSDPTPIHYVINKYKNEPRGLPQRLGALLYAECRKKNASATTVEKLLKQGALTDISLFLNEPQGKHYVESLVTDNNRLDLLELMIAYDADIRARALDKPNLLVLALRKNHTAIAEKLIALGADVNGDSFEYGAFHMTPLEAAFENGKDAGMVKRLLDAGADPRRPKKNGATPLATAERAGLGKIVDLMKAVTAQTQIQKAQEQQAAATQAVEEITGPRTTAPIPDLKKKPFTPDAPSVAP